MARSRGFFAEMQHQSQVAARQAEQRQRAAVRDHAAAQRRAEQAYKAQVRSAAMSERESAAEQKRFEREFAAAHVQAMQDDASQSNAALAATYEELDNLLLATLAVDDFIDLEQLRRVVVHPAFARIDLKVPTPAPAPIPDPAAPTLGPVVAPSGLFGRKKKLAEAQEQAEAELAEARARWQQTVDRLPAKREALANQYSAAENARVVALARELERFERECRAREDEVAEHNASVDKFIADLAYGIPEAVQEYVGIVLANSVYPVGFNVENDANFDPETAELRLRILVPGPDLIPTIKTYKYTKATDEITTVASSQKDAKEVTSL